MTTKRIFARAAHGVRGRSPRVAAFSPLAALLRPRVAALLVVAAAAIAPSIAAAAVSDAVRLLPHRRPILDAAAPAGAWREFREDSLLAAGAAADFRDVRVVTVDGETVPCGRVEPRLADPGYRAVGVAFDANGEAVEAGATGWSGIVRIDDDAPGAIALVLDPARSVAEWWIETSADSVTWSRAGVYPMPGADGSTRWEMGSGFRWARFVNPGPGWFASEGVAPRLFRQQDVAAPREAVPFRAEPGRFSGGTWQGVFEIMGPPRALAGVRFDAPGGLVNRPLRVEVRDERGAWRRVFATTPPPGADADGAIWWEPVRAAAVRLNVDGADAPNEPLRVTRLEAVPVRFLYRSDASPLFVAYGDPFAVAAAGGVPATQPGTPPPVVVGLGAEEANPLYEAPGFGLRWLARRPAILTVAMLVALAVVLLVALRSRPSRGDA